MSPIRVGILLDDFLVPAWMHRVIEIVAALPYVQICLVIKNASPLSTSAGRFFALRDLLFYRIYRQIDRRLFRVGIDAFAIRDLRSVLGETETIEVVPEQTKFSDRFSAADLSRIDSYRLDVLFRFGFRILRGDILQSARYGIWSYHHGDDQTNRGGPAGTWEVFLGQHTTGSVLQVLSEELDGGKILCRSSSATDLSSVRRNLQPLYWKAVSFLPRKLRELHELGGEEFFRRVSTLNRHPAIYSFPVYTHPENRAVLRGVARLVRRRLAVKLANLFSREQWMLFYSDARSTNLSRFKCLKPPRDHFWADPCAVEYQGRSAIFLEDFEYRTNKGNISVITFDNAGSPELPPKVVLERPYHLSYPFVFCDNGTLYMIPESSENTSIELYRCTRFPDQWEFVMYLMQDVRAVDATVWHYNDRYWLFTGVSEHPETGFSDELFLFYADRLESQNWIAHPRNPIVSDVGRARPAGAIFRHGQSWYRPAQDCRERYGRAIVINEITRIDDQEYAETPVSVINPSWQHGLLGAHTLSQSGRLTVVDAVARSRKW
jgi:hypothetical protein